MDGALLKVNLLFQQIISFCGVLLYQHDFFMPSEFKLRFQTKALLIRTLDLTLKLLYGLLSLLEFSLELLLHFHLSFLLHLLLSILQLLPMREFLLDHNCKLFRRNSHKGFEKFDLPVELRRSGID